jgi:transposase
MAAILNTLLPLPGPSLGPVPNPPIRRPKTPDLTRDQKHDCQLLYSIGWSYSQIHKQTSHTILQIQGAYQEGARATPKKRTSRPPLFTQTQVEELVEFVCVLSTNRRIFFQKLTEVLDYRVKIKAIRITLLREGFYCRLVMRKPPITEKNRQIRLD